MCPRARTHRLASAASTKFNNRRILIAYRTAPCPCSSYFRHFSRKKLCHSNLSAQDAEGSSSLVIQPIPPPTNATDRDNPNNHLHCFRRSYAPLAIALFHENRSSEIPLHFQRAPPRRLSPLRINSESNVWHRARSAFNAQTDIKKNGSHLRCQADPIHDCTHFPVI